MSKRLRLVLSLLLVLGSLPLLTAAGGGDARSEHQRIIDFWTYERVAQAQPRDFVRNPGGGYSPAAKPPGTPGGGGGGGGTGDIVSGASWTEGGEVVDTTGKVLFEMGGSYWVCSASLIDDDKTGRSIVLTAGHCVYDESALPRGSVNNFANNWMFIPNYDAAPTPLDVEGNFCDTTVYGCWTAGSLVVNSGYANAGGFNNTAVLYDWGFAVLTAGGRGAYVGQADALGSQAITFDNGGEASFGTPRYSFGYPAAQKYKGNDLTYCKGPIDGDPHNSDDTYRLNGCKMTGGSSGGPMFLSDFSGGLGTIFSLNSYGYSGVQAMHGPFFNLNTENTFEAALTASGDTIVP